MLNRSAASAIALAFVLTPGTRASADDLGAMVQGSRLAPDAPARDDPAAVTVIDLGQPGERGVLRSVSLGEAIGGAPGVQVRSSGGLGQFSGALLRGADSDQVAVFLDGVPLNGGGPGAVDLSQVPVDGVERVEIYRGVPPLELGSDAIGGAINLVSRRGGPSLWFLGGAGSFGLRKAAAGYSSSEGDLRVAASLSYQGATGDFPYYYTNGFIYDLSQHGELLRGNDGFDQGAADVRVTWERGGWTLRAAGHGLLKQQGVPGIGQPGAQPGHPDLTLGRGLLSAGATRRLLGGRLQLSADVHAQLERSLYRDLVAQPAVLSEGLTGEAGGQLALRFTRRPGQRLLALAEVRYERYRSTDLCPAPRGDCDQLAPTDSDRVRAAFALGGDLRLDDDRLAFQPGLHVLVAQSHLLPLPGTAGALDPPSALSATSFFPSPRIGARVRLLPWLLYRVSGGRFVRLPTFLELFGDRAFFRDSLALQPESSWTLETGLRAEGGLRVVHATLELTGFGRLVDNLIETLRDGPGLRARNVGGARVLGAEAELTVSLLRILSVHLTYNLLDARDETEDPDRNGTLLPGRPQHSVFLRAEATYGPWQLFYELDYTSLLYLAPGELQPRPERTLHALGARLGPYGPARLALAVELRNLADTRVVAVPLSLTSDGRAALTPLVDFFDYPLPGRALYATVSARL